MSKPFKLSSVLMGHSLDVRCVTATQDNSIISGSRDKTVKFWRPNDFNCGYTEAVSYRAQKNFVASVLYLAPTKDFPEGLIVTGGNDNTIFIYRPSEPFATFTIKEHTNTVCCLSKGLELNTFLSSSWDTSAKLWNLNDLQNSLVTYSDHTAAVWSVVQLFNSNVVTACADKTIGMWFQNGQKFKILQGHTDCVRGVIDFADLNYFASISNDASIKLWSYAGENIETLYGHTNYIYSIARNKAGGENCFVTSDEDRTIRYWVNGINTEVIHLPSQSVWSVCCLTNGDIVSGSSDGVVRIFTQDESRFADQDVLKLYEEEVNALMKQSCQEIGGYKVSDLPGREALYDPGKKAGQMKMIRESHGVVAYTWVEDGDNSHWEKVGDVLGGTDKTQEGKTTFEGRVYDFVFTVDVEDGKPPLKLPFNKGDDPYQAANQFLTKNMLPPSYLDQVVDFILKNSNTEVPLLHSDYVDPFTGGNRYTPSCSGSSGFSQGGNNVDPFTGAASYSTSGHSIVSASDTVKYFPQTDYRTFDIGDPQVILTKLKEFNLKCGDSNNRIDEALLEKVVMLCKQPATGSQDLETLDKLLNWPDDIIFPVIDVVRLAVKNEYNNNTISTRDDGLIVEKLKMYLDQNCNYQNNTLVTLRTLCNFFCHPLGADLMYRHRIDLLEIIVGLSLQNKNIEISLATFLLNTTILTHRKQDEMGMLLLATVLPDTIMNLNNTEGQFRALVALGTLLSNSGPLQQEQVKMKIKQNEKFVQHIAKLAKEYSNDAELKRKNCALQVYNELYNV